MYLLPDYTHARMDQYILDDDDLAYEYEIQKNPSDTVTWVRYIAKKEQSDNLSAVIWLYERLCQQMNDNNAWAQYIKYMLDKHLPLGHIHNTIVKAQGVLNDEKLYLKLLSVSIKQQNLLMTWHFLNLSLLHLNQKVHYNIWKLVVPFVKELIESPVAADSLLWCSYILQRYLVVCPSQNIQYSLKLLHATKNHQLIKDSYDLYLKIDRSLANNKTIPLDFYLHYLESLDFLKLNDQYETVIQGTLAKFTDQNYTLVLVYCDHLSMIGDIDTLETTLTDALVKSTNFDDFMLIYNYHIEFEQNYIEKMMVEDYKVVSSHYNILDDLLTKRDLKLNDLNIRQNNNLVANWLQRIEIISKISNNNLKDICDVFKNAILAIQPEKVLIHGSLAKLWCAYAQLYWDNNDKDTAREIYNRSLKVPFNSLIDLEAIWLTWSNNELLLDDNIEKAVNVLKTALSIPENPELLYEKYKKNKSIPVQTILFTSLKLWQLYLDLIESMCDNENGINRTIDVYENIISLKVATPIIFVNYAHFLQEFNKLKESFQVYERSLSIFPPETQYQIWLVYLNEVIKFNSILSKEHIRELFDQAISMLLKNKIEGNSIFTLYSDFEENESGLFKRSVDILLKGVKANDDNKSNLQNKLTLWDLCISKARRLLGDLSLRSIYEQCIQSLPNSVVINFVTDFAKLETKLNEIPRAREVLKYGAQLLPPSKNSELWNYWDEFELKYGDKEKYKEMLKLKRTLEIEMRVDTEQVTQTDGRIQFVASSVSTKDGEPSNPDELELDL